MVLLDISGYEDRFSLDIDGFEFVLGAYNVNTTAAETYMDSISSWLKLYLGCSKVFVFDCVTRHENCKELGLKDYMGYGSASSL